MSALPPKADIDWRHGNVCFVPKAHLTLCLHCGRNEVAFRILGMEPRSSTQCVVFAGSASANVRFGSLAEMATSLLSTIRRHGQWRSGIGLRARHGQCLGCGPRGRISARRGRHLVLDVPLDRLRFCNVLVHLFLLGSELLYGIPHNGKIACHLEPHQLRGNRGRGERWCGLSERS